jgi:murein DD-endopeptidase MepM/ murein hydrolase activator NlpD
MPRAKSPTPRVAGAILAALAAIVVTGLLTGGSPVARAAPGQLQQQISAGEGRVSALSGAVSSAQDRVNRLSASAAALQAQVSRLQSDLNVKRARLLALRAQLDRAQTRLAHLEAYERRAESVLAQQLVGAYEGDNPDVVTVVLESTGFQNLLERMNFVQRIGRHDVRLTRDVRAARRAVAAQATRLGVLSQRQQRLTVQVLYQRNRIARARLALVAQQAAATRVRNARAEQLSAARRQVASLRSQLRKLESAQLSPSGAFTFPMPKADVAPPATWSPDDGVDISAPGGTPEFAVCSGTVVLHGIGGFGPSAPVLHCDRPLAGYSYVYYGHAGPGNWVPLGTHVSQGQVISEVGSGIVGVSTGPHLEIGFAGSDGSPIGPSSAPAMLSLLHAAYGA